METEDTFPARWLARHVASALVILVVVVVFAARAEASVTTDYSGTTCYPKTLSDDVTYDEYGGIIAGSDGVQIICPIYKTTSSPGDPNPDKITDVDISDIYNNGTYPGIKCQVQVYDSAMSSSGINATAVVVGPSTTSAYDTYLDFSTGLSTQGWWGSSSSTSWKWTELECELQSNQAIYSYSVTEQGSDLGFHIYPVETLCFPADGIADANNYDTFLSGSAGYMAAAGSSNIFFYQCYLPGESAQFSMTESDNSSSGWQWSFSYWGTSHGSPCSNNGGGTLCSYPGCWSTSTSCREPGSANLLGTGSVWPSKIFPGTSTDLPATGSTVSGTNFSNFLDSSTNYYAYFKQIQPSGGGDMELVSIRTTGDSF